MATTAAILSIGDELLIGQVVNTNASWLGAELTARGVDVVAVSTVGDRQSTIVAEIRRLAGLADMVIASGGLGPTDDDRTRDAICELLGCGTSIDAGQLERIERRFAARGIAINERSRLQACVPVAARVLANEHGSAPGLDFALGRGRVIVLPGVPSELKGIVRDHLFPELEAGAGQIASTTVLVFGPTESALADMLAEFEALTDDAVTLAYLPASGGIRVRAMRLRDDGDARYRYERLVAGIRERAADSIVSLDGSTLPEATGRVLAAGRLTLATAESCTGGMIGELVTAVPGSSAYYLGGIVSYANSLKSVLLGVPVEIIHQFGAVSEPVACAMAHGAARASGADIAVAVTGIAGPGGGSDEKPVGTVWIAIASPRGVLARRYQLGDDRAIVRERAAYIALELVRREALALKPPVA